MFFKMIMELSSSSNSKRLKQLEEHIVYLFNQILIDFRKYALPFTHKKVSPITTKYQLKPCTCSLKINRGIVPICLKLLLLSGLGFLGLLSFLVMEKWLKEKKFNYNEDMIAKTSEKDLFQKI